MNTKETPHPAGVTDEAFDLMDWIQSGTVARRQVTIHNEPGLIAEYEEIQNQLADLGWSPDDEPEAAGDTPLGGHRDDPRVAPLLARLEDVWERWNASRAVWTVRAVSREEIERSVELVPDPKPIMPLKDTPSQQQRERWIEKYTRFKKEEAEAASDRELVLIATAVTSIETPHGTAESVTVEQLRAMQKRPHGAQWITLLYQAVQAATDGDVELPRPTWAGRSETPQA